MPSLNFNQITKAYLGNQEVTKIYHGDKQIFPIPNADPHWNNVVLLLRGDGVNNSTNIVDSSKTPKNVTLFGNSKISTAKSKYGNSSLYFDGIGDYLEISDSNLALGTGDFTIECWVNFDTINNFDTPFSYKTLGWFFFYFGQYYFRNNATELITPANHSLASNTWHHICLTRASGTLRVFTDGTLRATGTNNTTNFTDTIFQVGCMQSNQFMQGHVDSLRITKGIARQIANFNPETDTYLAY